MHGALPAGARWTMSQRNGIFRDKAHSLEASTAYKGVADKYNMSVATLSLAWCNQVNGVTATIIGATSMAQLEEDIAAFEVTLSEEMLADILAVLNDYPAPF